MQNTTPTRKFGRRSRWLLVAVLALLAPAMFLLPPGGAQKGDTRRPVPDVVRLVGPISQDKDLRDLPYIPPTPREEEEKRLTRHPPKESADAEGRGIRGMRRAEREAEHEAEREHEFEAAREAGLVAQQKRKSPKAPQALKSDTTARVVSPPPRVAPSARKPASQQTSVPTANMSSPTNTFAGMTSQLACNGCLPPDTDGDVGPNHYVQAVNSSIRIHDKAGNVLAGPITFNSFFSAMGPATPCGANANDGDPVVFYDHIADRWIITDFAFAAFPGTSFYQCIGVSKTSDPVTGGYWLYAVQVDPSNPNYLGDYPKFGLWPDGYYMSVNMFSNNTTFNGVRVYALDRASMINGGSANTIAFTILPADLGDQYSLLPATYRTGDPPPAGQPEWFMNINSSASAGTVENQVFVRRFHADFTTPANSFFGVGANHAPDAIITVNGFVDAFDSTSGTAIVPNGTANTTQYLDTLGDKLMYPLAYQNLGGVESIYSSHTVNNNQGGTGPTAIRWYQFNVTGNTVATTPVQQQSFNNGGDGLWRTMPSINVDHDGNVAIGYTASSATVDPGIRYAGRLAADPPNTMAQGEAVMTPGTGHQTSTSGRWGDYSSMFVDPTDGCTFYHTNEYYSATSASAWNTRVGAFKFPTCTTEPLPTPTPTATPTPTPTPGTPPVSAGPVTITASAGTAGPTDYATLQAAFAAINAGTHQGAINVWILGNTTETASAILNASGTGSAVYTSIIMVPSGTRTVAGNLAAPLIDLNGADVVTIDGLNSGGNSLTLSNTNTSATAGTSTVRFINGAQNNTVKRCNIQGSSTVGVGTTAGGAVLFSTTTGAGNNGNTVSLNNVGPAGANLPIKAIAAVGTTTNNTTINRDNVIDGNNVFDFFGTGGVSVAGIDIRTGNTNFVIQNNRIYQTATRTFTTTALRYTGINLVGTTGANGNAHTIRNNVIGFGAANGTGTTTINGSSNEFRGIDLAAASSGTATSVQGNVISGINQTTSRASTTAASSPFIGISLGTTSGVFDVGNLAGNQIGSLDGSSTIVINATSTTASNAPVIAIYDFSLSSGNVSNNNIGAITINSGGTGTTVGFRGILVNTSSAATETINNNTIGGPTAAGAITNNIVGSYVMYGIQTALPAVSMTGNTIRNLVGNSTFPATVVGSGIVVNVSTAVTNTSTISRNTVHSLSNASGAAQTSIYAMDLTLPATTNVNTNVIERNLIHSIVNTSTDNTSQLWGIVQRGSGTAAQPVTATVKNNMVRLGLDAAGNSITSGLSIIGIRDIQGAVGGAGTTVVNYQFNSVYIGGTGVASSSGTFAFNSTALVSTRSYVDNIFWNARSNASGTGKNYAISLAGTAINPAGLTSNYNDLFANGTGGFVGLFNAIDQPTLTDWQTASGQDANSISVNPNFVNPTGSATTVDLHVQSGSPVLAAGTPIAGITNDFDNDARDTVPDIGADEIPGSLATVLGVAPASGTYNGTVNLSATLTANAVGVSGKLISFTLNGNGVGSATTNGAGVASLMNVSLAGINAGTYPTGVGASFAGDAGYAAASGTAVLTVNQATTTTGLTSDVNPSTLGQTVTFTATVTSAAGTPTGTVNFKEGVTTLGSDTLDGSGVATFSTSSLSAGSHIITAEYVGDTNFSGDTSDPLTQQVDAPSFSIDNVTMAEGNAGTTTFTFTVTKTGTTALTATVNYATADGTATDADNDYEPASGMLTFASNETTKQFNVTVNGNTTPEVDETFTATLSSPSNATISQGTGTGTISNDDESVSTGQLIISEFRLRGPGATPVPAAPSKAGVASPCSGGSSATVKGGGAATRRKARALVLSGSPLDPDTSPEANDEFIELYNATNSPLFVATTDGSAGWAVAASDGVVRFIIPTGTVIPPRAHYLGINELGYSLGSVAGGDFVIRGDDTTCFGYQVDIPDNAGIALFRTSSAANFTMSSRLDAVGSAGEANTLYKEGTGYPALAPATNLEHSFHRALCAYVSGVGCTTPGNPKDSGDNATDFLFADTNGTSTAAGQRLGAPGPENSTSHVRRDTSGVGAPLLDGAVSSSSPPNRARDFTSDPPNNSTFGTLTIRRRVTNNTGAPVTQLRFRIVEMTTFPVPTGTADLRARTGIDEVSVGPINDVNTCAAAGAGPPPCNIPVKGTTLEQPPNQLNGGGYNSTLTVTLASPLANGASLPVNFLLGIQQTGTFRFLIIIEALP
ncbi:MAG TPA: Ig-like domain repeat protein [Pyrinomonadaceae bacterium]